ncbi:portal vertex protein [uncultured Caudovirales phage]|uniref:Portal vertex protein n=1 Tax=uncultured Caudovirales phage TaxID=2100421 RepID=A0A6J7X783_9CAUD|nr:portal vertex protein [uncultured Caudovirales phage]
MVDSNRESTFGRGLMKYVSSKLPYQSYDVNDKINSLNPKYELFFNRGSDRVGALTRQSVSSSISFSDDQYASILQNKDYHDFMYANIQPDKGRRLSDYRVMAAYSEVADALDEICDEFINKDDNGEIAKLNFIDAGLSDLQKNTIKKEFQKYIGYFDLEHRGWEYIRQLLVDAEIFWEHIIHKKYPKEGILGVISIPSDVIDPVYENVQNMIVKGYLLRKPIYDPKNPGKIARTELIPMDINQVTYINSGIWNENKNIRLPFIENARRAYRQLSLIEDAIVIYRLVRAPERLVFNVDVGNMAPPKAEAYLRKLMTNYWSKRTYDADQGATVQKFNPQSMLDSFWFAKRAGSEGTSVTQLAGGANLGELTDLLYFVKKLYKSLKVPSTRLNPEDPYKDGADILREELKFARFVIRQQQRFASGLKNGFITHLKLKGIYEEMRLKDTHLDITFNVPTNFYELRENQKFQLKAENFNNITQSDFVSKTYAQKRYLGWSDSDIMANREFLRKDRELMWELDQITNGGPDWREAGDLTGGAAGGEGAGGGTPAGTPPAFGPAPTGGAEEPPPEAEAPAGAEAGAAAPGAEAPAA